MTVGMGIIWLFVWEYCGCLGGNSMAVRMVIVCLYIGTKCDCVHKFYGDCVCTTFMVTVYALILWPLLCAKILGHGDLDKCG